MKRIKNLTLGVIGATILSLGLYACSNDNETTTTNTTREENVMAAKQEDSLPFIKNESEMRDYFNYYLSLSDLHSKGLDRIHSFIIDNNNNLDPKSFKKEIRLFCEENNIYINPGEEESLFMNYFFKDTRTENIDNFDMMSLNIKNNNPVLSNLLDDIETSVIENDLQDSKDKLISNVYNKIRNTDFFELTSIQQHSLLLSSTIFIDSYSYWTSNNLQKWQNIFPLQFGNDMIQPNSWPPSKADIARYIKIDAIGAGVGAIVGAAGGAATGAVAAVLTGGVLTPAIVVGAVAGAVGGSINGAITASGTAIAIDYIFR